MTDAAAQTSAQLGARTSAPRYELVDVTTGSLIGVYTAEADAFAAVVETSNNSGDDALLSVALGLDDPSGATDGTLIAQGRELLAQARRYVRDDPEPHAWQLSSGFANQCSTRAKVRPSSEHAGADQAHTRPRTSF